MNEQQPSSERRPRHRAEPSLDAMPVRSDDPDILARWEDGIRQWGHAFVAFANLRLPELHGDDVLIVFEDLYSGSFNSRDDLRDHQLDALGWDQQLQKFRTEEGIPEDVLDWDYAALDRYVELVYTIVESGGKVHLFAR